MASNYHYHPNHYKSTSSSSSAGAAPSTRAGLQPPFHSSNEDRHFQYDRRPQSSKSPPSRSRWGTSSSTWSQEGSSIESKRPRDCRSWSNGFQDDRKHSKGRGGSSLDRWACSPSRSRKDGYENSNDTREKNNRDASNGSCNRRRRNEGGGVQSSSRGSVEIGSSRRAGGSGSSENLVRNSSRNIRKDGEGEPRHRSNSGRLDHRHYRGVLDCDGKSATAAQSHDDDLNMSGRVNKSGDRLPKSSRPEIEKLDGICPQEEVSCSGRQQRSNSQIDDARESCGNGGRGNHGGGWGAVGDDNSSAAPTTPSLDNSSTHSLLRCSPTGSDSSASFSALRPPSNVEEKKNFDRGPNLLCDSDIRRNNGLLTGGDVNVCSTSDNSGYRDLSENGRTSLVPSNNGSANSGPLQLNKPLQSNHIQSLPNSNYSGSPSPGNSFTSSSLGTPPTDLIVNGQYKRGGGGYDVAATPVLPVVDARSNFVSSLNVSPTVMYPPQLLQNGAVDAQISGRTVTTSMGSLALSAKADQVADVGAPTTAQTPKKIQGEAWSQLERLEKNKLCHHCCKQRWQHSLLPVCAQCQRTLSRVNCQHCKEEFLQHRMLQAAADHFARPICLSCARNVAGYGLPKSCNYCNNWAAFGDNSSCDRCTSLSAKYGQPERCTRCKNNAAFKREPEKMEKIDNMSLCFQCTISYKKDKYKSQKKQHHHKHQARPDKTRSSAVAASSTASMVAVEPVNERIETFKREAEKQRGYVENLKSQLAQCQQQLKKKDAEILSFAKEIEQENFLLKKDSDENRRKACRDEQRIAQLSKEIADAGRIREKEITKLIESNQEERDKFNDLIDALKAENEKMQSELEKKRSVAKEAKSAVKDEQVQNERYKSITEKRVQKLSQKYLKTIENHEERARERNKLISNLRKDLAKLKAERERYERLERRSLGLEVEEEDLEESGLMEGGKGEERSGYPGDGQKANNQGSGGTPSDAAALDGDLTHWKPHEKRAEKRKSDALMIAAQTERKRFKTEASQESSGCSPAGQEVGEQQHTEYSEPTASRMMLGSPQMTYYADNEGNVVSTGDPGGGETLSQADSVALESTCDHNKNDCCGSSNNTGPYANDSNLHLLESNNNCNKSPNYTNIELLPTKNRCNGRQQPYLVEQSLHQKNDENDGGSTESESE